MRPLLLNHADVVAHLQSPHLLQDLRQAFQAYASQGPEAEDSPAETRGLLPGFPAWTERLPGGMEATGGREAILLRAAPSGELLAVIEAAHLTAVTRAVVGALATDVLARPEARHVALLGAGPGASLQLKTLRLVRSLESLRVWDEDLERSQALAARLHAELAVPAAAAVSVEESVRRADVVLCCTSTGTRRLWAEQLLPGAHVNVLGPEVFQAGPLGAGPWAGLALFTDASTAPTLQASASLAGVKRLGDVLVGKTLPREDPETRTAFVGLGHPLQDLAGAWSLYELLRDDPDLPRLPPEG